MNNTSGQAVNISHATADNVLKSVSSPNGDTSGTNPFLHLASSELDQSIDSITTDEVCIKEIGSDDSLNITESQEVHTPKMWSPVKQVETIQHSMPSVKCPQT